MEQKKNWHDYMPKYINLYPVSDYDNLDEQVELLQQCVEENSIFPVYDYMQDCLEPVTSDYLEEIKKEMEADGLEDEFAKHEEEISDWLYDHDQSDAIQEVVDNTSSQVFFYDLGVEIGEDQEDAAEVIMRTLGIKEGTQDAKNIEAMCDNATYGGSLRIYFEANFEDMIADNQLKQFGYTDEWKTICFHDFCIVAVWSSQCGAGDFAMVHIEKAFQFVRENLQISQTEKWNIENVCGLYGGWLYGCNEPSFDIKKEDEADKVGISEQVHKEREYQRVFNAGGCSFSDDNMERHRGVHYINVIPCGWKCPNCGRFWID